MLSRAIIAAFAAFVAAVAVTVDARPLLAQTPSAPALATAQATSPETTKAAAGDWGTTVRPKTQHSRARGAGPQAKAPAVSIATATTNPSGPIATNAMLSGDDTRTRLALDLTAGTPFSVFRMTSPYRVIIDLDDLEFRLPAGIGADGRGLVTSYRYGLFAPGKARIVIDTNGPVRVQTARIGPAVGVGPGLTPVRFEIVLVPTSATELAAAELASAAQSFDAKPSEPPASQPEKALSKPLIVVDPGHGGIDPGAEGAHGYEKDVVLAVSREIRRALIASRRYEVVMTRSSDVFIALDQRVKISRQNQADLFVSVHADSLAQKDLAQNIRGATVYTLAEKATDDRSRRLAEKENAADVLAGLNVSNAAADDQVRHILFDLVRRESANFSNDYRGLLVKQLRPKLALAKEPTRSAPFKVLRQAGTPAVLLELGYMSNAEDEKLLGTPAWQRSIGEAVARSIDDFFARHPQRP